jgi:hypothetical protein
VAADAKFDALRRSSMTREDIHRRISILCRRRHGNALYAVAYLTQEASTEVLERLLEAVEEFDSVSRQGIPLGDHLAAFEERFGCRPAI